MQDLVTASTRDGRLRGHRRADGATFLGIRFAAPPVGPLRWKPPQPVQPWTGVRDALARPGGPRRARADLAADARGARPHDAARAASHPRRLAAARAMFADTQFTYGTRLLAQGMAQREPRTWKYLFTRRRPGQPDGPHHGDAVGHVFGTLREASAAHDAVDEALSGTLRKAWIAFAATGDPQVPAWQPYRPAEDNHLVLGDMLAPGAAWRKAQLDFLERFFS